MGACYFNFLEALALSFGDCSLLVVRKTPPSTGCSSLQKNAIAAGSKNESRRQTGRALFLKITVVRWQCGRSRHQQAFSTTLMFP